MSSTEDQLICRCCLAVSSTMINIYSCWSDDNTNDLSLMDCLCSISNIRDYEEQAAEDEMPMPDSICENCVKELRSAYDFRMKCEKSDFVLRNRADKQIKFESISLNDEQQLFIKIVQIPQQQTKAAAPTDEQDTVELEYTDDVPAYITSYEQDENGSIVIPRKKWLLEHKGTIASTDDEYLLGGDSTFEYNIVEEPIIKKESLSAVEEKDQIIFIEKHVVSKSCDQMAKISNWFECEHCKKGFNLKSLLEKHMAQHNGKALHLCNFCGKMFPTDVAMRAHLLQHQGEKPYKCKQCDKGYLSKTGLVNHMKSHSASVSAANRYLCSICGKGFLTNQRLSIHTLTHTGEKNFSCDLCEKTFATGFRLRSHRRTHTGERPYECKECGLKFAQGNALKCHKRIHTGEKPYVCKFCNKSFSQNTILKTHMTLHTGKTVKCEQCDKKFSRASYLILHRREHTGEKPYPCTECSNSYKQKSHLDRHMDTHRGVKYKCDMCTKEYSKQWSLKMHMFSHTDEKPYKCTDCEMSFLRKDKFKNHLQSQHGKTI